MFDPNNVQALPIPSWFSILVERTEAGEIFQVPYAEIAASVPQYRAQLESIGIDPRNPQADNPQIGFCIIDGQITFGHRTGELSVNGAEADSIETARTIVSYGHIISRIAVTLDTHKTFQIFHPSFWVNEDGEHPEPFTAISHEDVRAGVWTPNPELVHILNVSPATLVRWALYYTQQLEENSQMTLVVWPYHAMLGGVGHALMPIIEATIFFWSLLRGAPIHMEIKGNNALTEMYGGVRAEVSVAADGTVISTPSVGLIRLLSECDYVWFAGQAFTHCVFTTCLQLHHEFGDPQHNAQHLLQNLRIFGNQSSPVPGFEDQVGAINNKLTGLGFRIIDSQNTPVAEWF